MRTRGMALTVLILLSAIAAIEEALNFEVRCCLLGIVAKS